MEFFIQVLAKESEDRKAAELTLIKRHQACFMLRLIRVAELMQLFHLFPSSFGLLS